MNGIPLAMLLRSPNYLHKGPKVLTNVQTSERPTDQITHKTNGDGVDQTIKVEGNQCVNETCNSNRKSTDISDDQKAKNKEGLDMKTLSHCNNVSNSVPEFNHSNSQNNSLGWKIYYSLGLYLLKNWMFVMFLITAALSSIAQDSLHWFIPDRAIEIGFTEYNAALTLTVANFTNIFSRVFFAFFSSDKFYTNVLMFVLYTFVSGLNSMLVAVWSSFWPYIIFAGLFGLLRGLYAIYEMILMADIVGRKQLHLGYGILSTVTGFFHLSSIPVFGYMNEVTESYSVTFLIYGALEIVALLFIITIPISFLIKKMSRP